MAQLNSVPVTKQPSIYNTFGVMGNEKIVHECTQEKGCCGCTNTYHTTLTDARLLIRTETRACGAQQSYTDVSIFLRDIAEIRQLSETRDNCVCCACCIRCCQGSKIMELRGVFGSKLLRVPKKDMTNLQIEIPALAGNHKLVGRR